MILNARHIMLTITAWWLLVLPSVVLAVDRNNFKTCEQSSFCRRLRNLQNSVGKYSLKLNERTILEDSVHVDLVGDVAEAQFTLTITAIAGGIFRVSIDEKAPLEPRYVVQDALKGKPIVDRFHDFQFTSNENLSVKCGTNKVVIRANPFKIEFYHDNTLVAIVNHQNLLEIEHLRRKPENISDSDDPGMWEENFKSHHDTKPRGPEAISVDIRFPQATRLYGFPLHADRLALRSTGKGGLDPYRLYNLDVFEYELDSTMALYGAVPLVYAHSTKYTAGVFWHNSAETWLDVVNSKDVNVMSSFVNFVSGHAHDDHVDVHFMSESGIVDFFVLMGPRPRDVATQYTSLTGVAPLPPHFSLGYHQSRWNYQDEADVKGVIASFDHYKLPIDVIWLDIEYTDGKKYFTWSKVKFPHPDDMVVHLSGTHRKLVVIIDPHVKRESGYFLHEDALANDLYVNDSKGNVYEGWCWPGASSYPDFFNPKVQEYYQQLYSLERFLNTTNDLFIWNDMNEPSVFNGPEVTMYKDCKHYGGWEHRHVHNLYGLEYTKITYHGLLARSPNKRPFILSRAHFAGTQRYAAIWTGDNMAEWTHLAASIPMCLSEALAGLSFCGADVGGFFGNPPVELIERWYQTAIWLPFFRAHAHIDTARREPTLLQEESRDRVRTTLNLRYHLLPLWYTLFYQHEISGEPVIRPLFYHYPNEGANLDIDDHLLIGDSILARPVTQSGVTALNVYFPGGDSQLWYDLDDYTVYTGTGYQTIAVDLNKNPAFYKGGSIIPRRNRLRRSSEPTLNDPYTLYVALNKTGHATGSLYIDDGKSFDYRTGKYLYLDIVYNNGVLSTVVTNRNTGFSTHAYVEKVIILGAPPKVAAASITATNSDKRKLSVTYDIKESLIIHKVEGSVMDGFTIQLISTK